MLRLWLIQPNVVSMGFQGIDPKLEFSSNSTIQETTVPGTYAELTNVQHNEDSESDSEVKFT